MLKLHPAVDDKMIEAINAQNTTWRAGRNTQFAGLSLADLRPLMGAHISRVGGGITKSNARDIPAQFDARKQWPGCVGPIRNQMQCGSCWAFGAAEALSDRLCIASAAGAKYEVLSPGE